MPNLLNQIVTKYIMADTKYFFKAGFWVTLNYIFSFSSGVVISYLFASTWSPEIYGKYNFITTIIGILSLVTLPGMGQAILQAAAENKDGVYKKGLLLIAKWSLIGTILLLLFTLYFYFIDDFNMAKSLLSLALIFPIYSISTTYPSYLMGKSKFNLVAIYNIISQIFYLVFTATTLFIIPTLFWVVLVTFYSISLINLFFTYISFKEIHNNQSDNQTLKLGVHLSFSQIFTIGADYFDRFLVPFFLGFSNNGIYSIAILIPLQLHNFFKVYLNIAQPKIAALENQKIKAILLPKVIQLGVIIFFIIIFYFFLSPFLFSFLYPKYLTTALKPSQLFMLSLLYFPVNLLALVLVKRHNTKSLYKINIGYATCTILSLLVFVPLMGILGAVLSKIFSRTVYSILILFYLNKSIEELD